MFKLVLAICVTLAVCTAEPLRARQRNGRFFARQELAPPAPAPTGYPVAGVTPEVPFELPTPTTTAKPDNTYLPPEEPETVYDPPAAAEPYNTYLPPDNTVDSDLPEVPVPEDFEPAAAPDAEPAPVDEPVDEPLPELEPESSGDENTDDDDTNVRQQEDAEEDQEDVLVAVAEDGSVISVSTAYNENGPQPARLVFQRFPQARRRPLNSAPARLRQRARFAPARYVLVQK